jgi:uncharacterized protein YndB with AHSA1/START domain
VSNRQTKIADTTDREFVVTRRFDAPRDLVFAAWTDPEQVGLWWNPKGTTLTTDEIDVRPGGVWRFTTQGADGRSFRHRIVYVEIVKPEQIVYKYDDESGAPPVETIVKFADEGGGTRVTMRGIFVSVDVWNTVKAYAAYGANAALDRLDEFLSAQ